MSYGATSGSTKTNLGKAKEILLKATQIDNENVNLRKMLVAIYHEYAMQKVREGNYRLAKDIVTEGLAVDSSDATLMRDMELILPFLRKKK
jgi:hypothetical protein